MAENPQQSRLNIPTWVALAGMILAFLVAIIIMATILQPLINLVFPADPKPPLPSDAVLLEEIENPEVSSGEWVYGSQIDGCKLAQFYRDEGSTCRYSPLICSGDDEDSDGTSPSSGTQTIAVCTGTKGDVVNSYSWEAYISATQGEYKSRIRLFLYAER